MDKSIAELNIEHYSKLLASGDLDDSKRRTVEALLGHRAGEAGANKGAAVGCEIVEAVMDAAR